MASTPHPSPPSGGQCWAPGPIAPPPPKVDREKGEVVRTGDQGESQATTPNTPDSDTRLNRRVCKKGPPPPPALISVPPPEDAARQKDSSGGALSDVPANLTWDQISELARKPLSVERYLPRPCKGLFEEVLAKCLVNQGSPNNPVPGIGDYIFILPKLILCQRF